MTTESVKGVQLSIFTLTRLDLEFLDASKNVLFTKTNSIYPNNANVKKFNETGITLSKIKKN